MLISDTDHLSILDRDTIEAFNIGRRLASAPPEEVTVTIITYEEQMRGWQRIVGIFAADPEFEETVKTGKEWRVSET